MPSSTAIIPAAPRSASVRLGSKTLSLSNLHKVFYPKSGFTKGQVIDYYARVAPVILKHLRGRPVTLKRYPDGVDGIFFYEKRCPAHRPDWFGTIPVWSEGNAQDIAFCSIDSLASLVWIANIASIELHVMLCTRPKLDRPTAMVFDFDPGPPANIADCVRAALRMRTLLKDLGLECFPKTSGGKGLHLYVPLNTATTFERTKTLAHTLALAMERDDPKRIISTMAKRDRVGKVLIDWSQNDDHKTTVCAYSLRAREHPTVSTPVTWAEVEAVKTRRDASKLVFRTEAVLRRIETHGDLFAPVLALKQKLPRSIA